MPEPARPDHTGIVSELQEHAADISVWLAIWAQRKSPGEPDPHARHAANDAMHAIDAMLAGLHQLRAGLHAEIRADDDEFMRRTAEVLASLGQDGGETTARA